LYQPRRGGTPSGLRQLRGVHDAGAFGTRHLLLRRLHQPAVHPDHGDPGGVLAPNVFRWYWWRMNGWGYAAGALAGMTLSLVQVAVERFGAVAIPLYISFPFIVLVVALVTVVASLATTPVAMDDLVSFYKKTGVWGFWGPVRRRVEETDPGFRRESACGPDLRNVLLGVLLLIGLYLGPMYLIVHRFGTAAGCLLSAVALGAV